MSTERPRRNVLLIVVDQWRGDLLPKLGTPHLSTPNIDRLCAEGVTFRNHFTTTAPCGPARASMLTGLYQMNHRAVQNTIPLDARFTNLGKELRKAGYDPALVGYTTTTPDPRTTSPHDPRFRILGDAMDGFRVVGGFEPKKEPYHAWLASRGFALPRVPDEMWLPRNGELGPGGAPSTVPAEHSDTSYFTERALAYLRGARDKPWFLHLGYWRPHPPFIAPDPYHERYDPADMPLPVRAATPEEEARQHPLLAYYVGKLALANFFVNARGLASDMSVEQVQRMRAAYYGLMTEVDDHVGRVLAFLDETDQWKDTLIVFTCDHGEQLGDHHLLGKIGYFDQSFRIPMVIRDPDRRANATRGAIVDVFTEAVDTMPTVLGWLGLGVPRQCDGRSLLPFCHGEPPPDWRTEVHWEFDFRDVYYSQPESALGLPMDHCSLAVVRDNDCKYVHFAALPPLFFDLREDPHEFVDRSRDPHYASLVRDYAQKMLNWRLAHADKALTGYRATPQGLECRA